MVISAITILSLLLLVLIAAPPLLMKDMAGKRVEFSETWTASEFGLESEKLTLETQDGIHIAAHEVFCPNPKAVIIFISGIHNPSVTAFFGHSKLLHERGYATILMEMRAHGESGGDTICLGYKEIQDTQAVVDYINDQSKYLGVPVVVWGLSMGGAVAINSTGEIREIYGLISMSAFSSPEDVFCDTMARLGAPEFLAAAEKPFVKIYTSLKYGIGRSHIVPKKEIKKLGNRPALIIHSREDSQVPFKSFERIMKNAPSHVETWIRDGDAHFIVENGDLLNPQADEAYTGRVLEFLNRHFGN